VVDSEKGKIVEMSKNLDSDFENANYLINEITKQNNKIKILIPKNSNTNQLSTVSSKIGDVYLVTKQFYIFLYH
jgi:hypothetical protein